MKNNKKPEIKGFIFDVGGVLTGNIGQPFLEHASEVLKVGMPKLKKVVDTEEPNLELGKITALQFWHNVCKKLKIVYPSNQILLELWLYKYSRNAAIKVDTMAVIKKLKRLGYSLAVVSNTQNAHAKINRKRKLYKYFNVTLLSCEVGLRKPDKAIFNLTSKKLGIPLKNLIFIDDELRWIKAAKLCKLSTIHFRSANQLKSELKKLRVL